MGNRFRTQCDTEVLLAAYMEWKEECAARLNGIFAFAVWDEQRRHVFLCRDRLGVNPLFYMQVNGALLFASEPKAILAHPAVKPQVGLEGLAEILVMGPERTRRTANPLGELAESFFTRKESLKVHYSVYTV